MKERTNKEINKDKSINTPKQIKTHRYREHYCGYQRSSLGGGQNGQTVW